MFFIIFLAFFVFIDYLADLGTIGLIPTKKVANTSLVVIRAVVDGPLCLVLDKIASIRSLALQSVPKALNVA